MASKTFATEMKRKNKKRAENRPRKSKEGKKSTKTRKELFGD